PGDTQVVSGTATVVRQANTPNQYGVQLTQVQGDGRMRINRFVDADRAGARDEEGGSPGARAGIGGRTEVGRRLRPALRRGQRGASPTRGSRQTGDGGARP